MIFKLSRVKPTCNVGIHKLAVFSLYNKKRFPVLKWSGVIRGSVKLTRKKRGWLLGQRLKGYVVKTKTNKLKNDGSSLRFFSNQFFLKNKKLTKRKYNLGPVTRLISHKKVLFKYPKHI